MRHHRPLPSSRRRRRQARASPAVAVVAVARPTHAPPLAGGSPHPRPVQKASPRARRRVRVPRPAAVSGAPAAELQLEPVRPVAQAHGERNTVNCGLRARARPIRYAVSSTPAGQRAALPLDVEVDDAAVAARAACSSVPSWSSVGRGDASRPSLRSTPSNSAHVVERFTTLALDVPEGRRWGRPASPSGRARRSNGCDRERRRPIRTRDAPSRRRPRAARSRRGSARGRGCAVQARVAPSRPGTRTAYPPPMVATHSGRRTQRGGLDDRVRQREEDDRGEDEHEAGERVPAVGSRAERVEHQQRGGITTPQRAWRRRSPRTPAERTAAARERRGPAPDDRQRDRRASRRTRRTAPSRRLAMREPEWPSARGRRSVSRLHGAILFPVAACAVILGG